MWCPSHREWVGGRSRAHHLHDNTGNCGCGMFRGGPWSAWGTKKWGGMLLLTRKMRTHTVPHPLPHLHVVGIVAQVAGNAGACSGAGCHTHRLGTPQSIQAGDRKGIHEVEMGTGCEIWTSRAIPGVHRATDVAKAVDAMLDAIGIA